MTQHETGMTQAEGFKESLPKTGKFVVFVMTAEHTFAGFVVLEEHTMYKAWVEALQTIIFVEGDSYITVTPYLHLSKKQREWIDESTPRAIRR